MEPAKIEQLGNHEGREVSLRGWLSGMRKSGKVVFLELRDGTGICQCVVEASAPEAFENAGALTQESSLVLEGLVRDEPRAVGGYEISATKVQPLQIAREYPQLGLAQVHVALAYYFDHREEIQRQMVRDQEFVAGWPDFVEGKDSSSP